MGGGCELDEERKVGGENVGGQGRKKRTGRIQHSPVSLLSITMPNSIYNNMCKQNLEA